MYRTLDRQTSRGPPNTLEEASQLSANFPRSFKREPRERAPSKGTSSTFQLDVSIAQHGGHLHASATLANTTGQSQRLFFFLTTNYLLNLILASLSGDEGREERGSALQSIKRILRCGNVSWIIFEPDVKGCAVFRKRGIKLCCCQKSKHQVSSLCG